jgi:hypothetical protein
MLELKESDEVHYNMNLKKKFHKKIYFEMY